VGERTRDGVRPDQWPPGSAWFRVIQSLIACAGLLLAPDSSYAQLNPLVDSLGLPDPIVQQLDTVCSVSPQSQGCTTALGKTVAEAIESVPPEALGILPEVIAPVISALDLPGDVASVVGLTCTSVPLSTACANLLNGLALQGPAAQQVVTNAVALSTVQTNRQITDFALSGAVVDGLGPASDTAAILRTVSPVVKSFAISGLSRTDHDGFVVKSPRAINARTPEFDSLAGQVGFTVKLN
jgi:hypothetical protein